MQAPPTPSTAADPDLARLAPVLSDLGLDPARVAQAAGNHAACEALLRCVEPGVSADTAGPLLAEVEAELAESGALLLLLEGRPSECQLAAWRNVLWPLLHVGVLYTLGEHGIERRTLAGRAQLAPSAGQPNREGVLLVARRRLHAMSPDATVEKFDANASGWNGDPSGPGYPHFRWMRRFVGCFAQLPPSATLLDFGCGAGWCGIEAAKRFGAASLRFFDPSPEMVRIAGENARREGLRDAEGRTGFGEAPPYPAAGEPAFDAVISSGVVSFSPDLEAWISGLAATVKPGGVLVVGDIQRDSRGMQRRRREKALLPARELNALGQGDVRSRLEAAGFHYEAGAGYQLTRPFPEAMHVNETRLGGLLTYPLLWSNQLAAAGNELLGLPGTEQFDSWVMRLRKRA